MSEQSGLQRFADKVGKPLLVVLGMPAAVFTAWSYLVQPVIDGVGGITMGIVELSAAVEELAESQRRQVDDLAKITAAVGSVSEMVSSLATRVSDLEERRAEIRDAPLRFAKAGHSISDGNPGGLVAMTWFFYKIEECGAPRVSAFFISSAGVTYRFAEVSIVDAFGRGVYMPVAPTVLQGLSYTARIPSDQGLRNVGGPQAARGYVVLDYSDACPGTLPVVSPEVPFVITPRAER